MSLAGIDGSYRPVPPRIRVAVATLVAVVAGHYAYSLALELAFHRDMGQLWYAAREVLHGRNPYLTIGPGRPYDWPWPLYYPLPAVLATLPLAPFSEPVAIAIFSAVAFGLFAWSLGAIGYPSLLGLFSFASWHAATLVQWSPLLAASVIVSPVSVLLIVKPTVGAALFSSRPTRWAIAGAAVLIGASFLVQPHWVGEWLAALRSPDVKPTFHAGHYAIVQFPGGPLVLLALLRWRRHEARLLAVLACVPQTLLPYEAVLLFLIPRGWLESIAMVVLSYVMYLVAVRGGPAPFDARTLTFGAAVTWTMYLPATLMVLRRTNEGRMPGAVESFVRSWPGWLRGSSPAHASH